MAVVNGVTFPSAAWLPDPEQVNRVGDGLLLCAYSALMAFGHEGRYERRFVGHGTEAHVEQSTAQQLVVVCTGVHLGLPNEPRFTVPGGHIGAFGMRGAEFSVDITAPYPRRQGGNAVPTSAIDAHRRPLWRDAWIVYSALVALALGGVILPEPMVQPVENGIVIGTMTPRGPAGGEHSWRIPVGVQLT